MSASLRHLGGTLAASLLLAALGFAAVAAAAVSPEPPEIYINGLDCTSATACIAVGSTDESVPHALAWTLEGGTWQISSPPAMTGSSELRRISCPTAGFCMAIGEAQRAALAMRLSGGVWTVLPMPKGDPSADLFGVSCPSTSWCMAAGQGSGLKGMVSAVFTGGGWRTVSSPAIKGASLVTLNDVDCASRRFCMAVGNTTDFGSTLHGELVTAVYNGSSWRLVPPPVSFTRTLPSLNGVSCPRAGECFAVGNRNFYTASPGRQLMIRFRAGRWTVMSAPAAAETEPLSVSCTAPGACLAVGVRELGAPVIERLAHGTWSMLRAPAAGPPTVGENGATFNDSLTSVTCTTGTRCVAVGAYNGSPFSETIAPSGASLLTVPVP